MVLHASNLSPRAWPSYSDLARSLGVRLTSFKRLRPVNRLAGQQVTRKVGNEMKVPPQDAVDILTEAGLSPEAAEREVADIIQSRSDRVPALARVASAALVRSSVGTLTGSTLSRIFYDQPSAAPNRKPDLQRIA